MLHPHGSGQWCIGFHKDVVLGTDVPDVGSGVERVHLNLVNNGRDARLGSHQFFDLVFENIR